MRVDSKDIDRDYDKEPIMIKNDYLLKAELTSRIALLILFIWGISINLIPEADPSDERYRHMALYTAILGLLWTLFSKLKLLYRLIRENLYISIYDN